MRELDEKWENDRYEEPIKDYDLDLMGVSAKEKKVKTPTKRGSSRSKTVKAKIVNANCVNVRKEPDKEGDNVLTTVDIGTEVEIVGKEGDFYKVQFEDVRIGYILKDFCQEV